MNVFSLTDFANPVKQKGVILYPISSFSYKEDSDQELSSSKTIITIKQFLKIL